MSREESQLVQDLLIEILSLSPSHDLCSANNVWRCMGWAQGAAEAALKIIQKQGGNNEKETSV